MFNGFTLLGTLQMLKFSIEVLLKYFTFSIKLQNLYLMKINSLEILSK